MAAPHAAALGRDPVQGKPAPDPVPHGRPSNSGSPCNLAVVEAFSGEALNKPNFLRAVHGEVRPVGLEPTRPSGQRLLRTQRLPIPPRPPTCLILGALPAPARDWCGVVTYGAELLHNARRRPQAPPENRRVR